MGRVGRKRRRLMGLCRSPGRDDRLREQSLRTHRSEVREMPQRKRIRFMVGFAAVLGACAGGVGCQTSSVHMDGYPVRMIGAARPAANATVAAAPPTAQAPGVIA